MPKYIQKTILSICVLSFVTGCASVSTVMDDLDKTKIRGYKQDKARVDQDISGKVGNWENAPMAEDPERKSTRKMYYLEFNTDADPDTLDDSFYEHESSSTTAVTADAYRESRKTTTNIRPDFDLPDFDNPSNFASTADKNSKSSSASGRVEQYKVQKDDTLQKIAKKYYDSYSKWPRIYEANKDVIKDPNFIKPGITIQIPLD